MELLFNYYFIFLKQQSPFQTIVSNDQINENLVKFSTLFLESSFFNDFATMNHCLLFNLIEISTFKAFEIQNKKIY